MEETPLSNARQWLAENPTESVAATARLFGVPKSTLQSSITRLRQPRRQQGGHNKLLTPAQLEALKGWIIQQYELGLGATWQMTLAAICHLRKPLPAPSQSWLTKLIKHELHDFHFITTKPLAQQRARAQDEATVLDWFQKYQEFILEHHIKPESIWNIDETGFRIGIPGGERVIVPRAVKELYTPSPENRLSVTVVEAVSVVGGTIPLPRLVTPPTLLLGPSTPKPSSFRDLEQGLQRWKAKLTELLSSPSQKSYTNWATGTEEVLASGQLQQLDLQALQQQVERQKKGRGQGRARLQTGGELTVEQAYELRAAKAELEAQKAQAKEARTAQQATNQVQKQLREVAVEARRQERLRKARVKAHLKAGTPVPRVDQDPIEDPEALTKPEPEPSFEPGSGFVPGFELGSGFEPEPEPGFELELDPGFEFELDPGSQLERTLQRGLE
ncbi:hypothetical protein V494_00721 [Pseudogymnoascus sp. VKM F-4513 (FW-928)]|nr:hypothetical protein V494_00721 [Pseudogymnoascus sp. VKM F-4513 (FW-928)]